MLKNLTAPLATIILLSFSHAALAAKPDGRPVTPPVEKAEICHCEYDEEAQACVWETINVPLHAIAYPHMMHGDMDGACEEAGVAQ